MKKRKSKSSLQILVYKEIALFFRTLLRYIYKLEIEGLENVPKEGPVIIAPNHMSSLDILAIVSALPRPIKALGKIERFKYPIWGRFAKYLGGIPVNREHPDLSAIKGAFEALKEGNILLVFPEGTRIGIKKIGGPKRGVAYLASRTRVPVIPTAIIGADKIWPPEKRIPHLRGKVKIIFGNPIYYESEIDKEKEEEFVKLIMEIINKLMVAEYGKNNI